MDAAGVGRRGGRPLGVLLAALLVIAGEVRCAPERGAPPATGAPAKPAIERLVVRVLAEWPHDPSSFTQGLVWHDGGLWESSGLYGRSELRRVELESGRVLRSVSLPDTLFGEGLALAGGRLWQLTYRERRALAWDPATLQRAGQASYEGEGWGLAFDGARLWMSDGSAALQVRDPATFALERRVAVTRDGLPQGRLNELEWAQGALWANVWQSDVIERIDPKSGAVTAEVDAAGLLSAEERRQTDVLNGIAYDPARRVFFITGKLWPKLFEVEFAAP